MGEFQFSIISLETNERKTFTHSFTLHKFPDAYENNLKDRIRNGRINKDLGAMYLNKLESILYMKSVYMVRVDQNLIYIFECIGEENNNDWMVHCFDIEKQAFLPSFIWEDRDYRNQAFYIDGEYVYHLKGYDLIKYKLYSSK
jgi:hypothetical protein